LRACSLLNGSRQSFDCTYIILPHHTGKVINKTNVSWKSLRGKAGYYLEKKNAKEKTKR
jgi:hypothetical protein